MQFDDAGLLAALEAAAPETLDALPFGVIGVDQDGTVEIYNAFEAQAAGLSQERVLGKHFFFDVAPCMNNFMVAERLEEQAPLDATLNYVLTFRMKPTPVRLRLLSEPGIRRRYVLVQRV